MTSKFMQTVTADAFISEDTGTPTLTSSSDITLNPVGQVNVNSDLVVTGDVNITGNISIGGNAYGGDTDTDSITFLADITSNILPDASLTYDLGSTIKQWNTIYSNDVTVANDINVGNNINLTGTVISSSTGTHSLGEVVINVDQISTNVGYELKLSSPTNLVLEPTDNIWISAGTKLIFEGTVPDNFEAKLQATTVTADRDIILPDASGTLALQSYVTDYISGSGNTLGNWTLSEVAGTLFFAYNGVNKMSLDSSGNLTVVGDITAFGTL